MRKYFLLFFILTFSCTAIIAQNERVLDYHAQVEVQADRSIVVSETIKVYAAGAKIKRGITRNFPLKRNFKGKIVKMDYDILEVKKNGKKENYIEKKQGGDLTLYFGKRNIFLTPGEYTYFIKYKVDNQIAFFEDRDEIYWNAIGTNVGFNIEKASCTVIAPSGSKVIQDAAYVGRSGATGKDYSFKASGKEYHYTVNRALAPREGFTIALGFEKGFFDSPGIFQRFGTLIMVVLGLLFLIPYYIQTWMKYGQDPPTPPSYPQWDSPDDLSAGSINYIHHGNFNNKSLTASIVSLAIKGYLKIEMISSAGFFGNNTGYRLDKVKHEDEYLPPEEEKLMEYLFRRGDSISIDGEYDSNVKSTYSQYKANLRAQHEHFIHQGDNTHLLTIPILTTIAVAILSGFLLAKSTYAEWINLPALFIFIPVGIVGLILYIWLIKKPTEEKLDLRSRINGFKMYLNMAEKDRLNLLNPPDLTPEHFEKALPFAFALGVEHLWTKKFENILKQMNYEPDWHHGGNFYYFGGNFGRDFSRTMSTASTPPQSSGGGGSGGGGFSGGGGGGGGVGGW